MKFELTPLHRNTKKEELLLDLKNTALKLNKKTITIAEYEQFGKYHPSTLLRKFKSWFKILELAGLESSRSPLNISEEELFKNIEIVWTSLGRQPKYDEIKNPISKYSAGTYENRFGSWRKALEKFIEYINSGIEETEELKSDKPIINPPQDFKHKTKREISDRLRFTILMRDGFTCKKCGKSPLTERGIELHVDHIKPWSKGGETIIENLETKCKQCNLGKGNAFNV